MVTHSPVHYTRGSIEVWDFIRDQDLNYHRGNAIKYICRAGYKSVSTEVEGLKKAIHYLENELHHTLRSEESQRRSDRVPGRVSSLEFSWESGDAEAFDR